MDIITEFDKNKFIDLYLDKKPVLIKNLFNSKDLELDLDEISGLAMEKNIVSRLIKYKNNNFSQIDIDFGPFTESALTSLPKDSPWSLFIQDVEKNIQDVQNLVKTLLFLPKVLLHDVMASISAGGGGAGPHIDWYSVFILQIYGEKNWKVEKVQESEAGHDSRIIPELDLKILKDFKDHDEINLEKGEVLYIPPGFAHCGSSEQLSYSLSVGYQSPTVINFIETYLQKLLCNVHQDSRLCFNKESLKDGDLKLIDGSLPRELFLSDEFDLKELVQEAKEREE